MLLNLATRLLNVTPIAWATVAELDIMDSLRLKSFRHQRTLLTLKMRENICNSGIWWGSIIRIRNELFINNKNKKNQLKMGKGLAHTIFSNKDCKGERAYEKMLGTSSHCRSANQDHHGLSPPPPPKKEHTGSRSLIPSWWEWYMVSHCGKQFGISLQGYVNYQRTQ